MYDVIVLEIYEFKYGIQKSRFKNYMFKEKKIWK